MARGASEPLLVLVVEMFVFSLGALGVQLAVADLAVQPALLTTTVVSVLLSSAAMAAALVVYGFWEGADPFVFVVVRAAWQWALASSVNSKVYATIVFSSHGASRRNWTALLFQTQTYEEQSYYTLAALTGVGLSCVSLVVMLQTVFYNRVQQGSQGLQNFAGRFAEMLAVCALLVQYSTERELARLCSSDGRRIRACELSLLDDTAAAEYGMLVPLGTAVALLFAVDVALAVTHARLLEHAPARLVAFYALLAALPVAGFFVVVFVVLQDTPLPCLVYLCVVGGLLAAARLKGVAGALLARSAGAHRNRVGVDEGSSPAPARGEPAPAAPTDALRLQGTAQRLFINKKRQ